MAPKEVAVALHMVGVRRPASTAGGDVSKIALIRFGPVCNAQLPPDISDREIYDQLRLAGGASVLVNHDSRREVGRILELIRLDCVDGVWHAARCEIDKPPEWLKMGTAASVGYAAMGRGSQGGREVIRHALVNEVSILPPSRRPAEPLAKVVRLRDVEQELAPGEILPTRGVLRREGIGRVLAVR